MTDGNEGRARATEADLARVRLLLRQGTDVELRLARLIAHERLVAERAASESALREAVRVCERESRRYARAASEAGALEDEIAAGTMSFAAKQIRALLPPPPPPPKGTSDGGK